METGGKSEKLCLGSTRGGEYSIVKSAQDASMEGKGSVSDPPQEEWRKGITDTDTILLKHFTVNDTISFPAITWSHSLLINRSQ